MNPKICEMVADRIIKSLDAGIIPWKRPWKKVNDLAVSHATLRPYSLINQFLCGGVAGEYVTYKQAIALGGHVKKGASGNPIIFWQQCYYEDESGKRMTEEEARDKRGVIKIRAIPVMKFYHVFHINDCEGIEPRLNEDLPCGATQNLDAEQVIEAYFKREGIPLNRDGKSNRAYYAPKDDSVTVPTIDQFRATAGYYATIFHEMIHSTGNEKRLARFKSTEPTTIFDTESYSLEELVAEIGSAALMNRLGLESPEQIQNAASYVIGWRNKIREDNELIIKAASRAEKAVEFILSERKIDNAAEASDECSAA